MPVALPYPVSWVLDFEFVARDGEHPEVVCLVAHELTSGRWVRVWRGEFSAPPLPVDAHTLLVGYSAAAEWSCFIALGWPMPARCIDLYAEFTRITNGAFAGKRFPSLLAAAHYSIDTMAADHKGAMRDLILTGGPWSEDQQREILDYCAALEAPITATKICAGRISPVWRSVRGTVIPQKSTNSFSPARWVWRITKSRRPRQA